MSHPDPNGRLVSRPVRDVTPASPSPPLARAFSVRVEFDDRVCDGDLLSDMSGNPSHSLFDFVPQVTTNSAGRAEIELTVPGGDVWSSILTAMTVIRQSGYDPVAVHGTSSDFSQERGLAA